MLTPTPLKVLRVFDADYKYLDSGPPASSNYTTLAFVHGMGFNGAVLERLPPFAHAHNLRIVSLYRRGYSPSSGFRDDELTGIGFQKKIDEAESFFRAQGVEIAMSLIQFATGQCIPAADPSNLDLGGIVLIGWSLGGIHVLASLAYLDELPADTQSTLLKYLHTVLCHDASSVALGIPNAPKHDVNLWLEPDDRKRFDAFFDWATAHYIHKSVTSETLTTSNSTILPSTSRTHLASFPTNSALSTRTSRRLPDVMQNSCFATLTKRALFDKGRVEKSPNLRVRFMSSRTGGGVLVWALCMLRKHSDDPPEALYGSDAKKARGISGL